MSLAFRSRVLPVLAVIVLMVANVGMGTEDAAGIDLHPPDHAEIFMDGLISRTDGPQMNAALSADGSEFLFCGLHQGEWTILSSQRTGDGWLEPNPLPFTSKFTDRDFTMSPDGQRILFGSDRPRAPGGLRLDNLDIVVSERTPTGGWSDPVNIGPPVNTDAGENYPSVAENGNLYFFSCGEGGGGGCDLYVSLRRGESYDPPLNLGTSVNSSHHDWDAFVAPDEDFIIFSSQNRPDSLGAQDLYISYRQDDGSWTKARNMGPKVNSSSDEICPSVSLDGEVFFFTSRRRGDADIYWMNTEIVDELRP